MSTTKPRTQEDETMLTQELPVKLTDEEKLEKARQLSAMIGEITRLKEEQKTVSSSFKTKIGELEVDSREIANMIREGQEVRVVEVIEEKDYSDRKIRTIRKDTGEVVGIRTMALEDTQEEMFGEDRHHGKIAYLGEHP